MRAARWLSVGTATALALVAPLVGAQPDEGERNVAEDTGEPSATPAQAPSEPTASQPPAGYYVEPPPAGGDPNHPRHPSSTSAQHYWEPPPPGATIYEPPPPPEPVHVAPKNALWLGARGGWWAPFGSAWGRCTAYYSSGSCGEWASIALRDFVSAGPTFELDAGARVSRLYNVYLAWERAQLGGGNADLRVHLPDDTPDDPTDNPSIDMPPSQRASSNFYALGVRFSSDADRIGFLADFLIGYRDLVVEWDLDEVPEGGIHRLTMSRAPLEFRFGFGADIRISPIFSLSPLVTIGSGRFGKLEWEFDDGSKQDVMGPDDMFAPHGWFTAQLGAHFDLGK